ncbi:MAG: UvrB/UvrC motif-containing protein [Gemmatimonadales bacterium]|nr:UvrB/UvrC motif-containing protein [Gemmatimonadales bacterium]
MLCENCKEREAVIHLTQIVNNSVTTMHLCEACAAERGVETEAAVAKFPLGDFLASLGKPATPEQGEPAAGVPCRYCGATLADFRQTGRLGCARCYESFEPHLRDLLRRLHGSTRHVGEAYRAPGAAPAAAPAQSELLGLRDQLRRAVDSENFELAAQLRDQIRVKE